MLFTPHSTFFFGGVGVGRADRGRDEKKVVVANSADTLIKDHCCPSKTGHTAPPALTRQVKLRHLP